MSGQVQRRNAQLKELLRSEFPRSPWGCAFLATNIATDANQTGGGFMAWWPAGTEIFDLGNDYAFDAGDGRYEFIAPATGTYLLGGVISCNNIDVAHTRALYRIFTSNRTYYINDVNPWAIAIPGNVMRFGGSTLVDMDAGDYAAWQIIVYGGIQDVGVVGDQALLITYAWGHRVS